MRFAVHFAHGSCAVRRWVLSHRQLEPTFLHGKRTLWETFSFANSEGTLLYKNPGADPRLYSPGRCGKTLPGHDFDGTLFGVTGLLVPWMAVPLFGHFACMHMPIAAPIPRCTLMYRGAATSLCDGTRNEYNELFFRQCNFWCCRYEARCSAFAVDVKATFFRSP